MRRAADIKAPATRVPVRRSALTAAPASRRVYPAWIDAEAEAVAFPARTAATPRVRDALVLRSVSKKKLSGGKGSSHGRDAR